MVVAIGLFSCREMDDVNVDLGYDYQPLDIGLFWEYEVEERIVFGENDSEEFAYFFRDKIDYSYINEAGEEVFVVLREKSNDRIDWLIEGNYSLLVRNQALVRMQENERVVTFSFPPRLNKSWDGRVYSSRQPEMFNVSLLGIYQLGQTNYSQVVQVLQSQEDDKITFRDNRYEVYAKGIGMIEQYFEVFTYCSRNDCLGQELIDSGSLRHLRIINYGKN
ncbi:hypothetical protein MM213_01945 [Belliella sp. R4-6]|uniref:NigD-like protein n=1 Tax=Belliella alkalica TaxID=1730871 RepID=A0ABS9V7X0_9BACT|nr:hypothetical protein [Belliella alkalica]MCH7412230.1 hypothetical protein [Belliella alkalica]